MTVGTAAAIREVQLIVGLEVHVELATRSKMFSRAANPAHASFDAAPPNSLIDPTVLGLPGALPVMNRAAVEMAIRVGLALRCSISRRSKWDRKNYFYPDMPKAYQISQYDMPLCFDGAFDLPAVDAQGFPDPERRGETRRIGIIRAHLEEDAGKLLHEMPAAGIGGGTALDGSIVDLNRAGTPLLEIVTQPDFRSADDVVLFAKMLRNICRFLGVTEGVMQKGHMRFEPNINCLLTLEDGRTVRTPVVEIKNLNSFRSVKGAIEHELREQPRRWLEDGREMGPGMKITRGWDDVRELTFVQREKEDAHDYRYFPDPDLPVVEVSDAWREAIRETIPELPPARFARYVDTFGLAVKEAAALSDERDICLFYEAITAALMDLGLDSPRAGKLAANWVLGAGLKRANERGAAVHELGISAVRVAAVAKLREDGKLNNQSADELFGALCDEGRSRASVAADTSERETPAAALASVMADASARGLIIVLDEGAMNGWIDQVLAANPKVVEDVRGGKVQAAGRLVGEVMKLAGGRADAKTVREKVLARIQG